MYMYYITIHNIDTCTVYTFLKFQYILQLQYNVINKTP